MLELLGVDLASCEALLEDLLSVTAGVP